MIYYIPRELMREYMAKNEDVQKSCSGFNNLLDPTQKLLSLRIENCRCVHRLKVKDAFVVILTN